MGGFDGTHDTIRAVLWEDDKLKLLDQRLLPAQEIYNEYEDSDAVAQAITDMVVRGAPAIGVTAAYGVVLAVRNRIAEGSKDIVSMKQGRVKWVVVGSDRIAANGDVANKIGTYSAAVAAKYHGGEVYGGGPDLHGGYVAGQW